ncbi:3' terminal RNA ribose 2'-O-methyltransferase Hen1 [Silanimonas sp.]|uniref:3' terminal RNA ribose 2'-O-methyltransferase Hen1 n=1 Tax=Silanimonas sp. TaxID=1929290 RepID=UPI0037CA1179
MLLSISTSHQPATDLGFLLVKHPDHVHEVGLPFGSARVFYPEASEARCTAVLMLSIDPVGLVRGRGEAEGSLAQYVNDRPYVASSFLSVAMKRVFSTAMAGTSKGRQDVADMAIPLEAEIPVIRCRGGEAIAREWFEPLGYAVEVERLPMDPRFPQDGDSPYVRLRLSGVLRLRELLTHLYVLLPALDGDKHYFVGQDEIEKLLEKGGAWLSAHPERETIVGRYLRRHRPLVKAALARLLDADEEGVEEQEVRREAAEEAIERPLSLNEKRMDAVVAALRELGARRVVDLGCGEGRLLGLLLKDRQFERLLGIDVSLRSLEYAAERLHLDRLPPMQRERITLAHGALTYRDRRIEGFDVACAIEVIEHMDAPRLPAFERALFGFARPPAVVITTPNSEHNVRFANLPAGKFRHPDHRFEWSRAEFHAWCEAVAQRNGYAVRYAPIGDDDPEVGPPTQMAIFTRDAA